LESCETSSISQKASLTQLLSRPQISLQSLQPILAFDFGDTNEELIAETQEQAEISIKYDSYIQKEKEIVEKLSKHENTILKDDFDYHKLQSLSSEAREKLSRIRPRTIGQASRISGVSPADIAVLVIYLSK